MITILIRSNLPLPGSSGAVSTAQVVPLGRAVAAPPAPRPAAAPAVLPAAEPAAPPAAALPVANKDIHAEPERGDAAQPAVPRPAKKQKKAEPEGEPRPAKKKKKKTVPRAVFVTFGGEEGR